MTFYAAFLSCNKASTADWTKEVSQLEGLTEPSREVTLFPIKLASKQKICCRRACMCASVDSKSINDLEFVLSQWVDNDDKYGQPVGLWITTSERASEFPHTGWLDWTGVSPTPIVRSFVRKQSQHNNELKKNNRKERASEFLRVLIKKSQLFLNLT